VTDYITWLHLFIPTKFPTNIDIDHELILYAILGVLCGVFGALFIQVMTKILFVRHRLKVPWISDRWRWCFMVALI
jgi:H+/Cl- antiporter ClcA